jgi:hypothetical protein
VISAYRNEFKEDITLQPYNEVAFYRPEFHNPQQMHWILLNCRLEGMSDGETHRRPQQVIWVYMGENTDDRFRGYCPKFPVLYFTCSLLNRTSLFSGMIARTGSRLWQQHPHFLLSLQAWVDKRVLLKLAVVVSTHFVHHLGYPQNVYGFVRVVKESTPHVIAVEKIEGPYHLVPGIWAATENSLLRNINNEVDLDMY